MKDLENKKSNIILDKSFEFAVRIVNFAKHLQEQKEYVISKQIIRSGTSIGANAEEAIGSISTPEFIHKLSIAYKEARETKYWLKLLHATKYLSDQEFESLHKDSEEICRILFKIIDTTKSKDK